MNHYPSPIITYEPDNAVRNGYFSMFREIWRELKQNRWLMTQLFKRDLVALYKQSFVGLLWAVILPLLSVGTFIVLRRSGVFSSGEIKVPYAVFAVLGISIWQLFATGITAGSNALVKAGRMIVKINFSKKSLVIAAFAQCIIPFAVQLLLFGILLAIYGVSPGPAVFLLPVLVLPVILFTLGLSFILSILNGIMRDIASLLSFLVTFLMFLTPILYIKPGSGILATITKWNPLYYLIAFPRDWALFGSTSEWYGYLWASASALVLLFACLLVFHLAEPRVTERV